MPKDFSQKILVPFCVESALSGVGQTVTPNDRIWYRRTFDVSPYWAGQRTIYALSRDLKTFSSPPRKRFGWDMATIDVIVRRVGGFYYAVIKDERYPTLDWPTGKTIRICRSRRLLGPYSKPGPPVSPGFREALMPIPSPDGTIWYLYYEQYPGISYGLSIAEKPEGPWYQAYGSSPVKDRSRYEVPAKARHGCMLPINRREYGMLVSALK